MEDAVSNAEFTAVPALTKVAFSAAKPDLKSEVARLIKDRFAWEKALAKTNKMLYALLGEVVHLTELFSVEELLLVAGKKVTPAAEKNKVNTAVGLVFGFEAEDRKKSSAYATAIKSGLALGQTSATIATWIEAVGGIEAARGQGGNTGSGNAGTNNAKGSTTAVTNTPATNATPSTSPAAASIAAEVASDTISEPKADYKAEAVKFLSNATEKFTIPAAYFAPEGLPFVESGYCVVLFAQNGDDYQPVYADSQNALVDAALVAMGKTLLSSDDAVISTVARVMAEAEGEADESGLDDLMSRI